MYSEQTGLYFENNLEQTSEFNFFNYMYYFNGGGVAVGDFNNDGLKDLFFTSNMGPNKLFINEGNLKFKDVTDKAGVAGLKGWSSGATVVDINNDGLLDIYVSRVGDFQTIQGHNELFVCSGIENGIPVFEDRSFGYGLDLVGFGTQATFLDYDLDGDLDLFQLNHSLHSNGTFGKRKTFEENHDKAGDRLLRNDGENGNVVFTDVTREAGIYSTVIGYGLGVAVSDINLDGWPDLYIGNDFHENDYLYLNNQDGTFKEVMADRMAHTSRFTMGVDIADINNDGHAEIMSVDMAPYDPVILKSSQGENEFAIFNFKLTFGYHPQFARNNLQLNDGASHFQEIALFAGVHATDWSWAPLFVDFDFDGQKDLFVSNGIPRRMNDIDYVNFRMNHELKWKQSTNNLEETDLVYLEKMPKIKLPNKFFANNGDLSFTDLNDRIINNVESYSNGAVYADLDNDGDLDIVVSNIEDNPFLYQNLTMDNEGSEISYLAYRFKGNASNLTGIGARIIVFEKESKQIFENYPVRGFQSCVTQDIHIGLQNGTTPDSVLIIWPDQTYERIKPLQLDSLVTLQWRPGLSTFDFSKLHSGQSSSTKFEDITSSAGIRYSHKENPFVEFRREGLMPHMVSAEGPGMAVGDVNGDGLDDVFFGSSKRGKSALYMQTPGGKFRLNTPPAIALDSIFEDVDAVFTDLENDGDLDLVIASGGNEYRDTEHPRKQRAYINDGKGNFIRKDVFGELYLTASCVLPGDFNNDGYTDFYFGARAEPWQYGVVPKSYLLVNNKDGSFTDVTAQYGEALQLPGLVKDGQWSDIDQDGDLDLLLACEWEPIKYFRNDGSAFVPQLIQQDLKGWWNFIYPIDYDQDGDIDLVVGNLGENTKFKPTTDEPIRMYVNDFDDNGQAEQIVTYFVGGREIPFANYAELTKQMVSLKKRYLYSRDLAKASVSEIFGKEKLVGALYYEATCMSSVLLENTGDHVQFDVKPLPDELQWSPLNAAVEADVNADGHPEMLLGGNFFYANIELGWYDANKGNVLSFHDGKLSAHPLGALRLEGQVSQIKRINVKDRGCFLFSINNEEARLVCPDLPES